MAGRLLGIARKPRSGAPVETIARATVCAERGIHGDHRGAVKPGGSGRRQVTVLALAGWEAALRDIGAPPVAWSARRANLLVDGVPLPRDPGARLRIGEVVLEGTGETWPCHRMEEVAPGLKAALTPDWRGGVTTRVLAGGALAIGDEVTVESK